MIAAAVAAAVAIVQAYTTYAAVTGRRDWLAGDIADTPDQAEGDGDLSVRNEVETQVEA